MTNVLDSDVLKNNMRRVKKLSSKCQEFVNPAGYGVKSTTASPVKPPTSYCVSEPILRAQISCTVTPCRSDGRSAMELIETREAREGPNGSPFISRDQVTLLLGLFYAMKWGTFQIFFTRRR
ncbi:hypothetical protein SAMN05216316_1574 [Nitrosovibrio sp. Nv6]|nr:hypothetical protein SAMN05216316_1574 [Nitrosovibrio sp. Nv6]